MIAEKYSARHFLSIQQALGAGESDNIYWLPGAKNPAGDFAKVRSDVGRQLKLLEPGRFSPGPLRPLKGVARKE